METTWIRQTEFNHDEMSQGCGGFSPETHSQLNNCLNTTKSEKGGRCSSENISEPLFPGFLIPLSGRWKLLSSNIWRAAFCLPIARTNSSIHHLQLEVSTFVSYSLSQMRFGTIISLASCDTLWGWKANTAVEKPSNCRCPVDNNSPIYFLFCTAFCTFTSGVCSAKGQLTQHARIARILQGLGEVWEGITADWNKVQST